MSGQSNVWPNHSATARGGEAMLPNFLRRAGHAFDRYFSVKPEPIQDEVKAASQCIAEATAAAQVNASENARLTRELASLDMLMRPKP